jgi:hypothetical protein
MKFKFHLRHFDWILNINFAVGGKRSDEGLCQAIICKIEPDSQVTRMAKIPLKPEVPPDMQTEGH